MDVTKDRTKALQDFGFKFSIGDIVMHRAFRPMQFHFSHSRHSVDGDREPTRTVNRKRRMFIVERHVVDCPGGTQWQYTCRVMHDEDTVADLYRSTNGQGFTKDYFRFNEIELMSEAESEAIDAKHQAQLAALAEEQREAREAARSAREATGATGSGGTGGAGSGAHASEATGPSGAHASEASPSQ